LSTFFASHAFRANILLIAILVFYAISFLNFPTLYIWGTLENLLGEWIQFFLFLTGAFLFFRIARKSCRQRWFYYFVSFALWFIAMEEISWGQQVFGWASSGVFQTHNLQNETNLHNFLIGAGTAIHNAIALRIQATLIFGYGVIYPIACRYVPLRMLTAIVQYIPPPPLFLMAYFGVTAFAMIGLLGIGELEIGELVFALAFLLFALFEMQSTSTEIHATKWLATPVALAALSVVIMFGFSSRFQKDYTAKLYSIYLWMGERYEYYGLKQVGLKSVKMASELYPNSAIAHYRTALALKALQRDEASRDRNAISLELNQARFNNDPYSVTVNLALADNYTFMNDIAEAEQYLELAFTTAKENARQKPNSAIAANELAKVYAAQDSPLLALQYFKKAMQFQPSDMRYRQDYFRALKDKN